MCAYTSIGAPLSSPTAPAPNVQVEPMMKARGSAEGRTLVRGAAIVAVGIWVALAVFGGPVGSAATRAGEGFEYCPTIRITHGGDFVTRAAIEARKTPCKTAQDLAYRCAHNGEEPPEWVAYHLQRGRHNYLFGLRKRGDRSMRIHVLLTGYAPGFRECVEG